MKNLDIYLLVSELFGKEGKTINVSSQAFNGDTKVTVSVFEQIDGVQSELHYATFDSEDQALEFYKTMKKPEEDVYIHKNEGYLIHNDDGSYTLNNYNNRPVYIEEEIEAKKKLEKEENEQMKAPFLSEIIGYSTRNDFDNKNGKVYVDVLLSIPVDIMPGYEGKEDYSKLELPMESQFWNIRGFRRLLSYLKTYLISTNSTVTTKAGTKFDIFELFLGNRKLDKLQQ